MILRFSSCFPLRCLSVFKGFRQFYTQIPKAQNTHLGANKFALLYVVLKKEKCNTKRLEYFECKSLCNHFIFYIKKTTLKILLTIFAVLQTLYMICIKFLSNLEKESTKAFFNAYPVPM